MTTAVNPLLVGLATWCLISVGLGLIVATALFPFLLWAFQPPARQWYYILPICLVQITHLFMMWTDKAHLAAYRFLSLPLRRVLLPVVMYVIKMDAVKEKEDVACMFWDEEKIDDKDIAPSPRTPTELVASFRRTVRREYKRKLAAFAQQGIFVRTIQGERELDLQAVLPILWQHQKRTCQDASDKNVYEEFIKRFLIVSVVPDGVLDLFYKTNDGASPDDAPQLVAFQMGIRIASVYYAFMYFSRDEARDYGIWYCGHLMALSRAKSMEGVNCMNVLTHNLDTKRRAGFNVVSYQDEARMDELFPWAPTETIAEEDLFVELFDSNDSDEEDDINKCGNDAVTKERNSQKKQHIKSVQRANKTESEK